MPVDRKPSEELKMPVDRKPSEELKSPVSVSSSDISDKKSTGEPQLNDEIAGYDKASMGKKQEVKEENSAYPKKVHTISIKDALQGLNGDKNARSENVLSEVDEAGSEAEPVQEDPIVPEFMLKCWNAYAELIREEKPRFSSALKGIEPVVRENHVIEISFSNQSQIDAFHKQIKSGLEQFLRRELQKPRICVDAKLSPTDEHNKKLYTAEDKLAYLGEKNPILNKFVQDLGLELE